MLPFRYVAFFALVAIAAAQEYEFSANPRPAPARVNQGYSGPAAPRPTPVAILKQINRHNEDGSYTYGYEGADGSFKIETKAPTGEVKGKYGYVDDTGKVRVVEYGATKYGFEPSGEGITVAPPTLVDESTDKNGLPIQYGDEPEQPSQPAYRPVQYKPAPVQYAQPAPQRVAAPVPQRVGPSASFEFGSGARSYAPAPQTRPQLSLSAYASPAPTEEETYDATPSPKITYAQPRPQALQFASSPAATQAITRPQYQPQYQPAPQPKYQPQPQQYQPAPQQYQPAPQQYQPRPAAPSGRAGGVLDQLAKDYALPSNAGAPLHDISFGYY